MSHQVIIGDCLTSLRSMASESVNCCVTSPPYFGLRSYLPDGVRYARLKSECRNAAYAWLAGAMNMPLHHCHMGMMDIDQCKLVIELCTPHHKPSSMQQQA